MRMIGGKISQDERKSLEVVTFSTHYFFSDLQLKWGGNLLYEGGKQLLYQVVNVTIWHRW